MAGKKAASLSSDVEQRLAQIERMSNAQVRKVAFNCIDDLRAGKITNREADAIIKAAKRRLRAFRRERCVTNRQRKSGS
jgi:hypothetical protein